LVYELSAFQKRILQVRANGSDIAVDFFHPFDKSAQRNHFLAQVPLFVDEFVGDRFFHRELEHGHHSPGEAGVE
jgi:hypothetical protein